MYSFTELDLNHSHPLNPCSHPINTIASKSVTSILPLSCLALMPFVYIYPHYVDLYILLHISLFNCTKIKDETEYSGND